MARGDAPVSAIVGIAKKLSSPHPNPITTAAIWSTVQLPITLLGKPNARSRAAQPAIGRPRRRITCQPMAAVTERDSRLSATRPATPTAVAVAIRLRQ